MFKDYALLFEDELLLLLCFLSYSLNMIMSVKDDNHKTRFSDWALNLASTFLWSPVAYYTAIAWMNIGFRMGLTITITMLAPDITKLIIDREFRGKIVSAIGAGLLNGIKTISNKNHDHE